MAAEDTPDVDTVEDIVVVVFAALLFVVCFYRYKFEC